MGTDAFGFLMVQEGLPDYGRACIVRGVNSRGNIKHVEAVLTPTGWVGEVAGLAVVMWKYRASMTADDMERFAYGDYPFDDD